MALCVNPASGSNGANVRLVTGYTIETCPYYLLVTKDEYQLSRIWPSMTTAEALAVAVPVLALWATAWGFRQLGEFIKSRTFAHSQE